jgi:hypothetical protein
VQSYGQRCHGGKSFDFASKKKAEKTRVEMLRIYARNQSNSKRGKRGGTRTDGVEVIGVAVHADGVLEGEHGVAGHAVPGLGLAEMEVVEAVQLVVLHVPREPAVEHRHVQHRRCHAGHVPAHRPQQRAPRTGGQPHVPLRLPDVPCCQGRIAAAAALQVQVQLLRRRESGARHVVAVLDVERPSGAGAPEKRLQLELRRVLRRHRVPRKLDVACLGAEGLQRVALAALPDAAARGAAILGGKAHLLEPRREGGRGGRAVDAAAGGRIGGEGGPEALDRGLPRRRRERGHDLADAVAGGLGLDLEDVGDGVRELGGGGAVLRRHGQVAQPLRRLHRRRRHGSGGGVPEGIRRAFLRRGLAFGRGDLGNWLSLTAASSLLQQLLPCCCCRCCFGGSEGREKGGTDGGERKTGKTRGWGFCFFSLDFGGVEMEFLFLTILDRKIVESCKWHLRFCKFGKFSF